MEINHSEFEPSSSKEWGLEPPPPCLERNDHFWGMDYLKPDMLISGFIDL